MERLGKFYISYHSIYKDKKELHKVFSILQFIPIRVESIFLREEIMYIGYSPLFDEVDEFIDYDKTPEYLIEIETKHGEIIDVRLIRK